jgi:Spy/CpxP family protein refolding chaperone
MMRLFILIAMLLPAALLAQMPRGVFPWWESPIARELNLSDDQQRQIREVLKEFRTKMIDQRATLEKAEVEFEDIMNEEHVDTRRANDTQEKVLAARIEMMRSFSQVAVKMRAVLTRDQWQKVNQRFQQMRGPGGPGGERFRGGGPPHRRGGPPQPPQGQPQQQ